MLTQNAMGTSRFSFWPRVREFAVPPSMIETATVRRRAGDWAGACAAAAVDVDLDLRSLARGRGRELVTRVRADLRRLAPDLLRWHLPRIAPDGLLRPGLTVALARYATDGGDNDDGSLHLVARTPPAWADGGQRISLALWDGSDPDGRTCPHPHPRPHRRFRLDLHRHLWDADRSDELRIRSGADRQPGDGPPPREPDPPPPDPGPLGGAPPEPGWAVDRWAAEARLLLHAEGRAAGAVAVRLGTRHPVVVEVSEDGPGPSAARITAPSVRGRVSELPVLPDAATWVLPDLALLRAGLIDADRLHPLVASALLPDHVPAAPSGTAGGAAGPRLVDCRGARHRIGLVDGVLVPLDHDPDEIRREELLMAMTGTPLPCLQVIDQAHRRPESFDEVRARLEHGDTAGALASVEAMLGPDALLRAGALREALEEAARRRVAHGLFRAGLAGLGPDRLLPSRPTPARTRPRHVTAR